MPTLFFFTFSLLQCTLLNCTNDFAELCSSFFACFFFRILLVFFHFVLSHLATLKISQASPLASLHAFTFTCLVPFSLSPVLFYSIPIFRIVYKLQTFLKMGQAKLCHHPPPSTTTHHQPKHIHNFNTRIFSALCYS